jgi:pimeloyl-ACP methyl ester carboxylesterase
VTREISQKMLDVNDIRMHVAEQGDGPAVLFCHGFPESWYSWRHQMAALSESGYRAIAPDLRGCGQTTQPLEIDKYTILHLVGDMVCLLDALKIETAVIVGSDWGATIAWHAALLRPDRFRAVVALAVPMMGQPPVPPTKIFPQTEESLFYTLYFQTPGIAEAEFERDVCLTLRRLLFAASGEAGARQQGDDTPNPFGMVSRDRGLLADLPDPNMLPSWLTQVDLDVFVDSFSSSGFRGALNYYRNLDRNRELLAPFNKLQVLVPALFLIGERDSGLTIPGMDNMISEMTNLVPLLRESVVLPATGHWAQQERPHLLNSALVSFLQTL